jgi:hypothetical protein
MYNTTEKAYRTKKKTEEREGGEAKRIKDEVRKIVETYTPFVEEGRAGMSRLVTIWPLLRPAAMPDFGAWGAIAYS